MHAYVVQAASLRRLLVLVGFVMVLSQAGSLCYGDEPPARPNMVVFLSDDHTWRDSSVYGSPDIETPNMQRLADAGMTFDNAFVASPSCAPSRAALLTGMYPARNGAEPNHSRPHADLKKLPAYLQELGYEVASFGKVGHYKQTPEYGFDVAKHFGYHEDVAVDEAIKWLRERSAGSLPASTDGKNNNENEHSDKESDRLAARPTKPLCLFVGTNWPHVPWPEDTNGIDPDKLVVPPNHVDTPISRQWRAKYVAAIRKMDNELGKVYDAAREVLGEDVFFLHTSDHGAQWPFGKWNLYDDGVRTPMIVSWPGKIDAGTRSDAMVSWIDVLPTLMDVAGEKPPQKIDGRSFLPVLNGRERKHRDVIFTTHSGDGSYNVFPIRAAYTSDGWKYIRNLHPEFRFGSHVTRTVADNGYWPSWVDEATRNEKANTLVDRYQGRPAEELYNIKLDPWEQHNLLAAERSSGSLAGAKPTHDSGKAAQATVEQRLNELRGRLDDWMKETGDTQTVFGQPQRIGSLNTNEFVNPIGEGADPWVVRDPNASRYLWCMSEGNRAIAIHTSDSVTSMGRKHIVWRAPDSGPVSREVWAPELHYLDDHWHIYFAASDGKNANHLAYVLKSKTQDPLGEYELHGPFSTGDGDDGKSPNIWAIDMTVLELDGKRYALWSGWDEPGSDQQYLYIAPMESPTKLAGPRVRICDNDDYLWERIQPDESKRGLHEAPQVFQTKRQTAVVYSCGASWLPTYKLGLLELVGDDPLKPSSWKKRPKPVFTGTEETYGVGHSCFVKSLDGEQWWHVFHAKRDREPGWRRAVFVQPMRVGKKGFPLFGEPVGADEVQAKPSGSTTAKPEFSPETFEYFGHHQYFALESGSLRLGKVPDDPINEYRSGEKVIFTGSIPRDVTVEVTIDFHGNAQARDAGILFRTTGASIGYDAQRGYFAGLIPRSQLVILGKTDGTSWTELARAKTAIDAGRPQKLSVQIHGDRITVAHNSEQKIQHTDETYTSGLVGLRVVNADASFSNVEVTP